MSKPSSCQAAITAIEYHLPERVLTNEDISLAHPEWSIESIYAKTGICSRHIARADETAGDLAYEAAMKLFSSEVCRPEDIDLLVLCTQTPDYAIPTTACLLQNRLGLPTTCAAFDFNLGCSGYVYGLSIVKGLLESGQCTKAILLTAETYSKWIDEADKGVRTVFGDGAAATLIELTESPDGRDLIGPFVFGTDGSGWDRLIVHGSGARPITQDEIAHLPEDHAPDRLFMDGPEIFSFTIRSVPLAFDNLLAKAETSLDELDLVVYHQANAYMLEYLRKRSKIPTEKFVMHLEDVGNTVSSSIPIALRRAHDTGQLKKDMALALVGFGVGYSWAAGTIVWNVDQPERLPEN